MRDGKNDTIDIIEYSRLISQHFGGQFGTKFKDEVVRKGHFEKMPVGIFYCEKCHALVFIPRV